MAEEFVKRGYRIIIRWTDNHLMLIDLRSKNLTGNMAEEALIKADITINKNMVPFDTSRDGYVWHAYRNTRNYDSRLKEKDVVKVVDLIDETLKKPEDEKASQSHEAKG